MTASTLDRQVQFYRARLTDNGLEMAETWETYGGLTWALRQDVKDAEKAMAGTIMATITSRFLVRSSEFTRSIRPQDRLICEGLEMEIAGIKQAAPYGRRQLIEITAVGRSDT